MQTPDDRQAPQPPALTDADRQQRADAEAFRSLVAIAPGRSDYALRVAIHLAAIQDPAARTAKASIRQLAAGTRVTKSKVIVGLAELRRENLIRAHQAEGNTASTYDLNFPRLTAISGPQWGPPSAQTAASGPQWGPPAQTTLELQEGKWSPVGTTRTGRSGPSISIEPDSILDRVLRTKGKDHAAAELDLIRSWAYKWLTMQSGITRAARPDDEVCARIIAAAGGAGYAEAWLRSHMTDVQANKCEYLVVWLLQDLHDIAPRTTKRRRAELRLVDRHRRHQAEPAPPIGDTETPDAGELTQALAAVAGTKRMR